VPREPLTVLLHPDTLVMQMAANLAAAYRPEGLP